MGKILRNRTLNKYLTLFNEERIILLYTFAKVIKMKCIILILNGYRYYGVILVFITIWYSYNFISLLRKRYWDILHFLNSNNLTSSVYCESGIETIFLHNYKILNTSSVYCESGIETTFQHCQNVDRYFISLLRKRLYENSKFSMFSVVYDVSKWAKRLKGSKGCNVGIRHYSLCLNLSLFVIIHKTALQVSLQHSIKPCIMPRFLLPLYLTTYSALSRKDARILLLQKKSLLNI